MDRIQRVLTKHLWWIVLLVAFTLLIVHTFSVPHVVVDNTSLILLAVVLASPFVAAIRKIKIGEFEADIRPNEVKKVTKQVEDALPKQARQPQPELAVNESVRAIEDLVESDPILALAKLRIELEARIRRLWDRTAHETKSESRNVRGLIGMVRELATRKLLDENLGKSLLDVVSICNRAMHGEDIRDVDAQQIVRTGTDLLIAVDFLLLDHITAAIETTIIAQDEMRALQAARYRLTTVIPYVESPQRRVYELTQEDLDDYLESYSEFAEFVVGLERID